MGISLTAKRDLPEFVRCINRKRVGGSTWCGKYRPSYMWNFVSIDHAAENGEQQGRLVACPDCVKAITEALKNGSEE